MNDSAYIGSATLLYCCFLLINNDDNDDDDDDDDDEFHQPIGVQNCSLMTINTK